VLAIPGRIGAAWRHWRHPVSLLERIAKARDKVAGMHAQVGLVFFMPRTRDRFRRKLWGRWQDLNRKHAMLFKTILANPALRAEMNRRAEQKAPPVRTATFPWRSVPSAAEASVPQPAKAQPKDHHCPPAAAALARDASPVPRFVPAAPAAAVPRRTPVAHVESKRTAPSMHTTALRGPAVRRSRDRDCPCR
jgi:hypothetical protein